MDNSGSGRIPGLTRIEENRVINKSTGRYITVILNALIGKKERDNSVHL